MKLNYVISIAISNFIAYLYLPIKSKSEIFIKFQFQRSFPIINDIYNSPVNLLFN